MTAQISDLFMYQGLKFDLAGISEGEIFAPELPGIRPVGLSTACYHDFHPPWKYRVVWELVFEDGRLTQAIDCSKRMAEAREQIIRSRQDDSATDDQTSDLYAWIAKSFDRSYQG